MSSLSVSSTKSTYNKQNFLLYHSSFKFENSNYILTSEVFNIFCNTVAIRFRAIKKPPLFQNICSDYIEIFSQLKALNGVTSQILLTTVENAQKIVDDNILKTDLYEWQLIAEYNIYSKRTVGIYFDLCDKIPFKKLYEEENFNDFELYAENDDPAPVPVHRNVLAVSSPVLKSMLLGDWKEAKQGYVQLPDVTKTTLQHLKDYIYLNQLPKEPIDYAKLITLASYYMLHDLPELEKQGAVEIPKKFEPENVWEWLEYCVQQKHTKLLLFRLRHSVSADIILELEKYFGFNNEYGERVLIIDNYNNNFKDLYEDTDFMDFELRIDDDNGIYFHKNVLAALSPVMTTHLLGDWKEAKEGYVQIQNLTKATLQHFKDYLYLKKLPEDAKNCTKLFPLAAHYKMPELEWDAAIKISQSFKPENAWDWIEYCVQNKNGHLLVAILNKIKDEDEIDRLEKELLKK